MNKRFKLLLTAGLLTSTFFLSSCQGNPDKDLLLHLNFDEGIGCEIADSAGKLQTVSVNYNFTNASFTENMDPQWRPEGVNGGCLLFDGNSTFVSYENKDFAISGDQVSISVWVAPRAFEWDDPNAKDQNTQKLTSIVAQYNKGKKQGFILGYERYGQLCFEVGTEKDWHVLWGDEEKGYLEKDVWNYVTAVFDGKNGKITLYLNGEEIASKEIEKGSQINTPTKAKLYVGKNDQAEAIAAGTYCMFSGLMDDLKIYNCALSAEDAQMPAEPVAEIDYNEIGLENVLTKDIYKTQFHGGPYEHWMNEPHSPVYYNGMYHLFFQQNMVGTYWRNIQWGHLVSEDMVNWKPVKEAICASKDTIVPDGVWSGNAAYDKNGVPLLFFTAGNDSFAKEGMISNQNIGVAYPSDLSDQELTDWVIYDELAVVQKPGQGRAGEFRDPYIWQEDGKWFMLICGGSASGDGGSALLYQTETLELKSDGMIDMNWEYVGPIFEMERQSMTYGTSWELPILLHMKSEDGKQEKDMFLISPAPAGLADNKVYYFLGKFDAKAGTFTPDPEYKDSPALLDYGDNVFTGPSVMTDPETGEYYVFSIMQDKRTGAEEGEAGWAHCVGLTRHLWMDNNGEIRMEPVKALEEQEDQVLLEETELSLDEANQILSDKLSEAKNSGDCATDLLHVKAVIDPVDAKSVGITVKADESGKGSDFTYDVLQQTISGLAKDKGKAGLAGTFTGPLKAADDGSLSVDIYIDRSLVEAYFNTSRSISLRSYSDFEDRGIFFSTDGKITIKELHLATMKSIY